VIRQSFGLFGVVNFRPRPRHVEVIGMAGMCL
jgi:hypothetical protein